MTTTCVVTERLRNVLANEPDIDRKLARQLLRYLHAYELGRLNYPSQPENIIWMEHLFFNLLVFCRKEMKVSAPAPSAEDLPSGNEWFEENDAMTRAAYDIHLRLVEEGYDTDTDPYYTEFDKRLGRKFPQWLID